MTIPVFILTIIVCFFLGYIWPDYLLLKRQCKEYKQALKEDLHSFEGMLQLFDAVAEWVQSDPNDPAAAELADTKLEEEFERLVIHADAFCDCCFEDRSGNMTDFTEEEHCSDQASEAQ